MDQVLVETIKTKLEERKKSNPRYSIRAMARDCGINPSCMNRLLNAKKSLTPLYAYKLSRFLKLNDQETISLIKSSLDLKENE